MGLAIPTLSLRIEPCSKSEASGLTRHRRVYLDQAATTWPKLPAALEAAEAFLRDCGATAGRGAYASAQVADRWIVDARHSLSRLINAPRAESIALCTSGTHALNAALVGLLQTGQHVVTTAAEHNSVLRPLHSLRQTLGLDISIVPCDAMGWVDPSDVERLVRRDNSTLVIGHASNVTGVVQDLAAFGEIARNYNLRLIVDASQTIGYLPIDVQATGIHCLAAAGHKGLRALPGTGFLYVHPDFTKRFKPLMFGGTGTSSERIDAESIWPTSVEVGNHNLPGVVSMAAAASHLLSHLHSEDSRSWTTSWKRPMELLVDGLSKLPAVRLFGSNLDIPSIPVVSFLVPGWDIHELAAILDSSFGIEARAGLHCAALIHAHLGTQDSGGTVRFSLGHDFPVEDIEYSLDCLTELSNCHLSQTAE